jgi:hypothetical protein
LVAQNFIETLFNKIILTITQKVLIPCENFKSRQATMVPILSNSHSVILGCDRLPPLKGISSPRFGEARKKEGFGLPRWLPPLKETFVDSLGLWVQMGAHFGFDLALGHILNLWLASIFLSNRWVSIHNLGIKSPSRFA